MSDQLRQQCAYLISFALAMCGIHAVKTQCAKSWWAKQKMFFRNLQAPLFPCLYLQAKTQIDTNCIIIHTKLHCKHNLANKPLSMIRVVSPHVQEADLSFLRTVHPVWLYGSSEAIDSKRSVTRRESILNNWDPRIIKHLQHLRSWQR